MDCIEQIEHTTLPGNKYFYNRLNKALIDSKEYNHAWILWNTFKSEIMLDYTQLYNKSDVLILAGVMENFRDECLQSYGLDSAWHYWSDFQDIPGQFN